MKRSSLVIALIVAVSISSCRRNTYRVNITGIEAGIDIMRLEQDLFVSNDLTVKERVPVLIDKYGEFLQLFSNVINTGDINSPAWHEYLTMFVNDRSNFEAFGAVSKVYDDISWLEQDLNRAFRHYLYYFPSRHVPDVYTCITGFNNSIIIGDTILAVGLERYLGPETEFYGRLGIYKYLTYRMDKPFIVPDCMYAWAVTEWDYHDMEYGSDNLFSRIIHEGKLFYFVRSMLPDADEKTIFGFTDDQMKFCRNNEDMTWEYLVEHDLLFNVDQFVIRKLTGEAPFTTYFTNESPGRAALWTGFRIVEEYMKRNGSVTLEELMMTNDYQSILSGSRYSP